MAFRRRYRRRRFRRRRYYKKKQGLASKALSMAWKVKRLLNVEYKFHDVQVTGSSISTTPTITQLSNIALGDTASTRDGNSIKWTRFTSHGTLSINSSATRTYVRMLLILDTQTNGAIYTAGDILQDTTADDAIVSLYNLNNRQRFKVLYDKVVRLASNTISVKTFKVNKSFSLRQIFNADSAAITSIPTYSLSLMFISNEATNTPTLTMYNRLRYIDN